MQELLNDAAKAGNLPEILRSKDSCALPILVPNFGFVRAAVVLRARLLTLAVVALLLGGTAAGGMPVLTEYARTRPDPFLVGISGVLKKTNAAPPRDPSHTAMEWGGWLRVPNARVYRWSGLTPSRHAPPCCRNGWTAVMYAAANDHHAIVGKLVVARADVNTKENNNGCAFPGGPSGGGRSAADRLRLRRPAGPQRCT